MCPLEHQLLGHGEGLGSCGSSIYNLISLLVWRSPYLTSEQRYITVMPIPSFMSCVC